MITNKKLFQSILLIVIMLFSGSCLADEVYRLRIYFGLSLPGGGAVSLNQWQQFEKVEIPKVFDGFNVVDSTGYYKGAAERSKIVTVIVNAEGVKKARDLSKLYAKRFKQESVMIVKVPVLEWSFIEGE